MPESDSSGVIEPVNLNIINEQQYNDEVEKVKKFEILANRAKKAKQQLAQGNSSFINVPTESADVLPKNFNPEIEANPYLNPQDYRNQFGGTGILASGVSPTASLSKTQNFKQQIEDDVKQSIYDKIGLAESTTNDAMILFNNPASFLTKYLKALGPEAMVAILGAEFIGQVAEEIFNDYKSIYGPGGWFDTRKAVLDATREIAPLNTIENIANGTIYFTDDAGQRLKQRAPEASNTRLLRDSHVRYLQLHIGE